MALFRLPWMTSWGAAQRAQAAKTLTEYEDEQHEDSGPLRPEPQREGHQPDTEAAMDDRRGPQAGRGAGGHSGHEERRLTSRAGGDSRPERPVTRTAVTDDDSDSCERHELASRPRLGLGAPTLGLVYLFSNHLPV